MMGIERIEVVIWVLLLRLGRFMTTVGAAEGADHAFRRGPNAHFHTPRAFIDARLPGLFATN
jgi:hypothetical protein